MILTTPRHERAVDAAKAKAREMEAQGRIRASERLAEKKARIETRMRIARRIAAKRIWVRLHGPKVRGEAQGWLMRIEPRPRWWRFLRAVFGGFVGYRTWKSRAESCGTCPYRRKAVDRKGRKASYCGACDCGFWFMARLSVKNWLRGWNCPERIHEGPYTDDRLREALVENGYATEDDFKPVGRCGSCSGKSGSNGSNGTTLDARALVELAGGETNGS